MIRPVLRKFTVMTRLSAAALVMSALTPSSAAAAALAGQVRLGAISPDKARLFIDYCATKSCSLAAVDIKSGRMTLFKPTDASQVLSSPSISADGKRLAVSIKDGMNTRAVSQIGVLDLETNRYRVVTRNPTFKDFPSLSPDGTRIIFAQAGRERREGRTRFSDWEIHEVELSGGTQRQLTRFCFFLVGRPQYFPDGKAFLFSGEPACNYPHEGSPGSRREYAKRHQENTIFRMGAGPTSLHPFLVRGAHSNGPRLSQDGRKIVFVSRSNDLDGLRGTYNYDLFILDGKNPRRLTSSRTMIVGLAASSDVELVAYASDEGRNGDVQLWLMDVKSGAHRPLQLNERELAITQVVR